ncbi:MAG: flagellar hook-length control protein FliK [Pseudomonadales bacterium]
MTISTLLSLQHTSSISLNSETSEAGHLTDLAGYFQTTLQKQIAASSTDANADAVVVDQAFPDSAENALLLGGEALPVAGTNLPAQQAALGRLSVSFSGPIGSGKQDLAASSNSLPFSQSEIERALQGARQYFSKHAVQQNASVDAKTPQASLTVPNRSAPVQFSELSSTSVITPAVQDALKLAERTGVLFESSVRAPALSSQSNAQHASLTAAPISTNYLAGSTNNINPLMTGANAPSQNVLVPRTTTASAQVNPSIADGKSVLNLKSLTVSSVMANTVVKSADANQPLPITNANQLNYEGISLNAAPLLSANEKMESLSGRLSQQASSLNIPVREQLASHTSPNQFDAAIKPAQAIQSAAPSSQPSSVDLTTGRQFISAPDAIDAIRDRFAESNDSKVLPANQNASSVKQPPITSKMPDQAGSDPLSMLNRQALNAESFRNTIKTAQERGLGRQQENAIRSEQNSIGDTRPLDGDNGRTIALPSVTGTQAVGAQAPSTASAFVNPMIDMAAGQADAAAKLGQRIQWMVNANSGRADIQIDPPELGSVQIQVSQEERQTTVSFVTQNASARELIEQSLPRLREHLENLGIELADASVEQQTAGHTGDDDTKSDAIAKVDSDENTKRDESNGEKSGLTVEHRDGGIDAYA